MFGNKKKQMAEMIERLNKELEDSKSEKEALKGEVDTLRDTLSRSFDNIGKGDAPSGSSISTTIMSMDADALTRNIMTRETEFLSVVKNMTSLFESAAADNRAVSENVKVLTEVYGKMNETVVALSGEIEALQRKLDAVVGLSFVSRSPYDAYTKASEQPAAPSREETKPYEKYTAPEYTQPVKPTFSVKRDEPVSYDIGSKYSSEQHEKTASTDSQTTTAREAEPERSTAFATDTYKQIFRQDEVSATEEVEKAPVVESKPEEKAEDTDSDLYGLLFSDSVEPSTSRISDSFDEVASFSKDIGSENITEKFDDDFDSAISSAAAEGISIDDEDDEVNADENKSSASHWRPFDRGHGKKSGSERDGSSRSGLTPEERRKLIERAMNRRR